MVKPSLWWFCKGSERALNFQACAVGGCEIVLETIAATRGHCLSGKEPHSTPGQGCMPRHLRYAQVAFKLSDSVDC